MLKTVHLSRRKAELPVSYAELCAAAEERERANDLTAAVTLYKKSIALRPVNEFAYNRLMIIYRRQKEYKQERGIIKTAIKVYEELYKPKRAVSRMVSTLSNRINKATGLADKSGKSNVDIGPVGKWRKRLQLLNKRINK